MKISEAIDSLARRRDFERLKELDAATAEHKEVWDAIAVASKSSELNSPDPVTVTGVFNRSFDDGASCWIKCDKHTTSLGGTWFNNFGVHDSAKDSVRSLCENDRVSLTSHKFMITSIHKIEVPDDER